MDLQELISRGRFIISNAPERLRVFTLVNGKRNTRQIAKETKRHINNVRRDLQLLCNAGLIAPKTGKDQVAMTLDGLPAYEKVPLARTVPLTYFRGPSKNFSISPTPPSIGSGGGARAKKPVALAAPSENEVLDICKHGEDQIYEFKGQGVDVKKLTREVAAMLNTRQGGLIFYGIDDDGTIQGTDITRQKLDQPLQNSIKDGISPAATVKLHSVAVIGHEVLVIVVPPWNRRDVYQCDGRVLLRKGTNVFAAKPEESKKLHKGEYVV